MATGHRIKGELTENQDSNWQEEVLMAEGSAADVNLQELQGACGPRDGEGGYGQAEHRRPALEGEHSRPLPVRAVEEGRRLRADDVTETDDFPDVPRFRPDQVRLRRCRCFHDPGVELF